MDNSNNSKNNKIFCNENYNEKEQAFECLEKIRKEGMVNDYELELANYRIGKYGQ